jgi:hypothetical protein
MKKPTAPQVGRGFFQVTENDFFSHGSHGRPNFEAPRVCAPGLSPGLLLYRWRELYGPPRAQINFPPCEGREATVRDAASFVGPGSSTG